MKKYWLYFLPIFILIFINGFLITKIKEEKSELSPRPEIKKQPSPTEKPKKITIVAVGDISLAREVNYQIQQQNNPLSPFEKIAPVIKKADLAIGNLESPLINNCPIVRSGFKFCGEDTNVKGITYAGFDSLNLANNHSHNYGLDGYQETKEILRNNDLNYFDSQTINYQTINNLKISLIGFDDTVSRVNKENLKNKISQAQQASDLVIVNFHWGNEYKTEPNQRQIDLAYFSIDNGADIIVGHHPHVIQPLRYYQGKPIFYSLGNFVFDQMWSEQTKTGAIGWIEIENDQVVNTRIEKTYMSKCCQPELLQ
jgi:poly-gamma-glutamate synthesis protein (capsule biosynthesis protein)